MHSKPMVAGKVIALPSSGAAEAGNLTQDHAKRHQPGNACSEAIAVKNENTICGIGVPSKMNCPARRKNKNIHFAPTFVAEIAYITEGATDS